MCGAGAPARVGVIRAAEGNVEERPFRAASAMHE